MCLAVPQVIFIADNGQRLPCLMLDAVHHWCRVW